MRGIGIDIGTTTICALCLEDSGAVIDTISVANDAFLPASADFERVQDAEKIVRAATGLIDTLVKRHGAACVGISNQMHGILYCDKNGRAVSPLYIWQDARGACMVPGTATTYAQAMAEALGHKYAPMPGYGLLTHYYNVKCGLVPQNAVSLCTIGDYLAMRLCGLARPVCHVSNAASLGVFDLENMRFDLDALGQCGLDAGLLPQVRADFFAPGRYRGAQVCCAAGDNQCSFIGSCADPGSQVLVNIGTGGQISYCAHDAHVSAGLEVRPLYGGRYLRVGATLCAGRAYSLLERFFAEIYAGMGGGQAQAYDYMNALAQQYENAPERLFIDTRFSGSRDEPAATGAIRNLTARNFFPGQLVRGVIEGIAGELRALYTPLPSHRLLVLSGNGARKNPALARALGRAFAMEPVMPAHTEEAAYGAALCGLTCAGAFDGMEAAQKMIAYLPTINQDI